LERLMKYRQLIRLLTKAKSSIANPSIPVIVDGSADVEVEVAFDKVIITTKKVVKEEKVVVAPPKEEKKTVITPPKKDNVDLSKGLPGLSAEDIINKIKG